MKIQIRFILAFIGGLLLFVLLTTSYFAFFVEFIFETENTGALLPITYPSLFVFISAFIFGGIALGVAFVPPLLFMLSIIKKLSAGNYELTETLNTVYRRNGRLKIRYALYKELISDLYKLAENLQKAEIERKKLDEAKAEWVAGVSHDLKTPLSYVTGYSALLLSDEYSWNEEESKRFLSQIYEKSVYIEELISEFNLSIEPGMARLPVMFESFDLVGFLRSLIADVANMPNADKYEIEFQTEEDCFTVSADKKLLRRALQNLLVNAIKHNPFGTKVSVELKQGESGKAVIYVSDNGDGMEWPPKSAEEKRGRGLSVVKGIIAAHNGEFTIESTPARGTVCTVTLSIH